MEDKEVIDMVNNKRPVIVVAEIQKPSRMREFLLTALRMLLWILAGVAILALMVSDQIAVWLAMCFVCGCVAAAAINVDRYIRKRW